MSTPSTTRDSVDLARFHRQVRAMVARYDRLSEDRDEDGQPYWRIIAPGAFDRWVTEHRAEDCELSLEHDSMSGVGEWEHFYLDRLGLSGVAYIKEGPIGDEFLEACRDHVWGCSITVEVAGFEWRSEPGPNGWPVFVILEADPIDAGPVSDPADDQCRISQVGFDLPKWRRDEESRRNAARLAEAGIISLTTREPFPWRVVFGR